MHRHNFYQIIFHLTSGPLVVSLHVLHQVGPIGKHLGAQGAPAPALLLAVQALVLHVSHTVSESLGAKFTAEGGLNSTVMLQPRVSPQRRRGGKHG